MKIADPSLTELVFPYVVKTAGYYFGSGGEFVRTIDKAKRYTDHEHASMAWRVYARSLADVGLPVPAGFTINTTTGELKPANKERLYEQS